MSEEQTRSVLLLALGPTAVRLWHSGEALNYVRPGLAPLVLVAGVSIACLGGHSHGHSTRTDCSQPDRTQRNAVPT